MRMTRQHFQLIADVLKDTSEHVYNHQDTFTPDEVLEAAAIRFEAALSQTNDNFNGPKFLEACKAAQ